MSVAADEDVDPGFLILPPISVTLSRVPCPGHPLFSSLLLSTSLLSTPLILQSSLILKHSILALSYRPVALSCSLLSLINSVKTSLYRTSRGMKPREVRGEGIVKTCNLIDYDYLIPVYILVKHGILLTKAESKMLRCYLPQFGFPTQWRLRQGFRYK